jgi:hypothetical protein
MSDTGGPASPGDYPTATEIQQAQATEDQLVQAIAIALFEVMEEPGMSPWESTPIPDSSFGRGFRIGHAWELYAKQARGHLAAMNVLAKFVSGKVV